MFKLEKRNISGTHNLLEMRFLLHLKKFILPILITFIFVQCEQKKSESTVEVQNDFQKFTGRWKLGAIQIQDTTNNSWNAAGGLNRNRSGFIIYDGQGGMGVHHVSENYKDYQLEGKGGLDSLSHNDLKMLATNFVYFGKYRVNEKEATVEHHIESHIYPHAWNSIAKRKYEFREDSLILSPIEGNFTAPVRLIWLKLDDRP